MPHLKECAKASHIFWQEFDDEGNPPEPAILIEEHIGTITLSQGNESILISTHELKNFIRALTKIEKYPLLNP